MRWRPTQVSPRVSALSATTVHDVTDSGKGISPFTLATEAKSKRQFSTWPARQFDDKKEYEHMELPDLQYLGSCSISVFHVFSTRENGFLRN